MRLKPRSDRPIDQISLAVIRAVTGVATELGLETFMVGATARIILLENVFGLPPSRATRDIDFAFAVESWERFQVLKQRLASEASFKQMERVAQRLTFKPEGMDHSFVVDLIPFGGLETEANMIAWPPDMSVIMNVAGYRDAHATAVPVEVEPGLVISLASIPGIAVLKIFAWVDRGQEDPKDAIDLVTLLRQYHEAGNQDRVYVDSISALEEVGYDIELAGAWLLGNDASAIALPTTRRRLEELFTDPKRIEGLVTDMSRAIRARDDALEYSRTLLEQFVKGFLHNQIDD
jgi:predicted nucleotidyltransferase